MRIGMGAVHRGVGDFVPGKFALPQNPVLVRRNGMGDFMRAAFAVPQSPVGMGHLGCGGNCNCGPCNGGMGQTTTGTGATATSTTATSIDLSLEGVGIASALGITSVAIPNWVFYGAGAVGVFALMSGGSKRRR
jgi:hypothetical protein